MHEWLSILLKESSQPSSKFQLWETSKLVQVAESLRKCQCKILPQVFLQISVHGSWEGRKSEWNVACAIFYRYPYRGQCFVSSEECSWQKIMSVIDYSFTPGKTTSWTDFQHSCLLDNWIYYFLLYLSIFLEFYSLWQGGEISSNIYPKAWFFSRLVH